MARSPQQRTRIGVFGTYGFGNMGDAAVADATIAGLRRHFVNPEFLAICQQPENAEKRHQVKAVSIYRDFLRNDDLVFQPSDSPSNDAQVETTLRQRVVAVLKSIWPLMFLAKAFLHGSGMLLTAAKEAAFCLTIYRVVRSLDLLVMAGSGQLNEEWGGPWRYPFGLFRWCLLARVAGCKIAFLSVGTGGDHFSILTKFFCSTALRLAHYKSIRDIRSREIVKSWGVRDAELVPDMAFSLKFNSDRLETSGDGQSARSENVGINPIAFGDPRTWNEPCPDKYDAYIGKMCNICAWLISNGYRITFVPNDLLMENLTIDDIVARLPSGFDVDRPKVENYRDVFKGLASCDYVICSRFHGMLFSLLAKKPIISLAHHYKFFELGSEMGQQEFCLSIESFDPDEVKALFRRLRANRAAIVEEIKQRSEDYSARVERQFQKMAEIVLVDEPALLCSEG